MRLLAAQITSGERIHQFFGIALEIRRFEKNYFLYGQRADLEENRAYVIEARRMLSEHGAQFAAVASQQRIGALIIALEDYDRLISAHPPGSDDARREAAIRQAGKEISTAAEQWSHAERAILQTQLDRHRHWLLAAIGAVVLFVVVIGQMLAWRVARPLRELEHNMAAVAEGRLAKLDLAVEDREIASLTSAFNHVLAQLETRQGQLVRSEKLAALGTLLSGAAHELNNPLSNISTSCEILAEEIAATKVGQPSPSIPLPEGEGRQSASFSFQEKGGGMRGDTARGAPMDLLAFREKPDAATAQAYVSGGRHFWNSGIFMLRASVWLKAIGHFAPEILAACRKAVDAAKDDGDFVRLDAAAFAASPADSIDYAVMEKLPAAAQLGVPARVVPLDVGWSDVGAWDALWQAIDRDADDNAVKGDVWLEDSHGNLVIAEHGLVACIGCEDMVVVETADAVLIAPKARTQEVKTIVSRLKAAGRSEAELQRKVHRPWGWYDSIDNGERFQVKRIVVRPGATLSLQMHHHRAEHWVVVRGTAKVTRGTETLLLGENESTYIPLGVTHRLENPGQIPLEIIEVQSGSYLGEDDIVRFEDNYGRKQ
jgi:mannose-1-phosphate guanylyltransferase/mannose-6-phosphate isomerase